MNGDGDVDIIVGCGNNVNTTAGIDIIDKADMTVDGLTDRKTAKLTDNQIAAMLYEYLTAQA